MATENINRINVGTGKVDTLRAGLRTEEAGVGG